VLGQTLDSQQRKKQQPFKKEKQHIDLTSAIMEENAKLYGGGGSGVHGHEEETDQSSPHSQNHRHIKLKQKLIYELSLKIEGTDTKIEIQEGDSISEIVEHLALQYKLSKDFQDALEIYIDRKL